MTHARNQKKKKKNHNLVQQIKYAGFQVDQGNQGQFHLERWYRAGLVANRSTGGRFTCIPGNSVKKQFVKKKYNSNKY